MPEDANAAAEPNVAAAVKSKDEVALELMKFIAVTTGYGKGGSAAGYGAKPTRTAEEYADSLIELFERCRKVVNR